MENLTIKILAKFSIVIIGITAFGTIINNIHLGLFNLVDFNIVQTRSIYVGFIFSIFMLAHLVYYLALIDTKDILKNKYIEIVYKTIIKLVLVSNFLFYLLNFDLVSSTIVDSSNYEKFLIHGGFLSFLAIISLYGLGLDIYRTDPKHIWAKLCFIYPIIFFIVLSLGSFVYNIFNFSEFKKLFNYELYFAIFFLLTLTMLFAAKIDASKGIKFIDASLFSKSPRDKKYWLEDIFLIVYITGMIFIFLYTYSSKIYPLLDVKYGGGKPKLIIIDYQRELIKGELIYQDNEKYYLLNDSTILFLDKNKVNKLYLKNAQCPTSNISNPVDSAKFEVDEIKQTY